MNHINSDSDRFRRSVKQVLNLNEFSCELRTKYGAKGHH